MRKAGEGSKHSLCVSFPATWITAQEANQLAGNAQSFVLLAEQKSEYYDQRTSCSESVTDDDAIKPNALFVPCCGRDLKNTGGVQDILRRTHISTIHSDSEVNTPE